MTFRYVSSMQFVWLWQYAYRDLGYAPLSCRKVGIVSFLKTFLFKHHIVIGIGFRF